jgi:predicted metalloprotease with PDZ domain
MKKFLIFAFALALTIFSAAPIGASDVDLEYTVTIQKPENHVAHVRLIISDIDNDVDFIHLSITKPSDYNQKYVENLIVTSAVGSVHSDLRLEGYKWICEIATGGENTVTVEYDVSQLIPARGVGDKYISYIGSEFAVIDTSYLFLIPDYLPTSTIRVDFELPSGWRSATIWDEVDGVHEVDWKGTLKRYIALGPFIKDEATVNNVRIIVARHQATSSPVTIEKELEGLGKLTGFYTKAFGFVPTDRTLWITAPTPMYYGKIRNNTFIRLTTPSLRYFWRTWAHEYCHLWNGGVVFFDDSANWFGEGATNFFSDMALLDTGLLQKSELRIFDAWASYKNLKALGEDEAVAGTDSSEIIYKKGELVTYLLSKRIAEVTNGEKSIYDVAKYLFQNCRGRKLDSGDLLEVMNQVTNRDFTGFFSDYVYGTEALSLDELDKYEVVMPELVKVPPEGINMILVIVVITISCGILICAIVFARRRVREEEIALTVPHEF